MFLLILSFGPWVFAQQVEVSTGNPLVGFVSGRNFETKTASADLSMTCLQSSGQESSLQQFTCLDESLKPVDYDYFRGPAGVQADMVEITSNREDGTTRYRASPYNSAAGQTSAKLNLWVKSLVQKALLAYGKNRLVYKFKSKGRIVNQGEVIVMVDQGALVKCPAQTLRSLSAEDCRRPYSICQQYLAGLNYCQ